jgi:hypothetical protein
MFNVYASDYRAKLDAIPLGQQGEEDARCLVVDITDAVREFGTGGALSIRALRPGESVPYPVSKADIISGTDASGNPLYYARWTLTLTDTAVPGFGKVQVRYAISDTQCYTWVYRYSLLPSLIPTGDPPDPFDSWLDALEDIAGEARSDADAAATSAEASAESAAEAKDYADHIADPVGGIVTDWLNDNVDTSAGANVSIVGTKLVIVPST